jgi:topoisomerase-4 subunit A
MAKEKKTAGKNKKKADTPETDASTLQENAVEKNSAPEKILPADKETETDTDISSDSESPDQLADGMEEAESLTHKSGNLFLRKLMDSNFIEYASYVIKERAIPDVDDGLKPVQRRILWALQKMEDGKFHKVANVIGDTMKYHPHGDASIGDALVVLANKEYYIEKQGNFGNILTGDGASAARYIECRLSPLAKEVLFNNDITEFIDSYDGRNQEPVTLPVKIPSLLMLGADGIAVGMATKVLPHNFKELLEAQIATLRKQKIELYPDFIHGGIMDVSEYNDGNGKITIRAKIDKEGRKLIIRELPATTTTESLINSIEKAVSRNKIKVASINDYTTDKVEIEVTPMRGYDSDKCLKALYAYTDCSVSISANLTVICDNRPCQMSVTDVIKRNTEKLRDYLKRELEIELGKLEDKFHNKTLAQIFIENRIYKRIEECKSEELVFSEVHAGLKKFRKLLKRAVTDEDVERLLAIPIRRISLFDINKNKKDIDDILRQIEEVKKNLAQLTRYAVKYLKDLIAKYAEGHERRTEIESFDRIDKQAVALNNIKVAWDRKGCYIGTSVKSDERVTCNEYDHLLCIERKGNYKVINIPEKIFIGRLYYFTKYDKDQMYFIVYSEKKTGKFYAKKTVISKFITDKEYTLCPEGCKLEIITTRANSLYEFKIDTKIKDKKKLQFNLSDAPERTPKARGQLISPKKILGFKFIEIIEDQQVLELPEEGGTPENSPDTKIDTEKIPQEKSSAAEKIPQKTEVKKKEAPQPPLETASKKKEEKSKIAGDKPKKKSAEKIEAKIPESDKDKESAKSANSSESKTKKQEDPKIPEIEVELGVTQPEFGF